MLTCLCMPRALFKRHRQRCKETNVKDASVTPHSITSTTLPQLFSYYFNSHLFICTETCLLHPTSCRIPWRHKDSSFPPFIHLPASRFIPATKKDRNFVKKNHPWSLGCKKLFVSSTVLLKTFNGVFHGVFHGEYQFRLFRRIFAALLNALID